MYLHTYILVIMYTVHAWGKIGLLSKAKGVAEKKMHLSQVNGKSPQNYMT